MESPFSHLPLFRSLTGDQIASVSKLFQKRALAAREVLFREGDAPDRLAILMDGELELNETNEPQVILRPVTTIGELGALTGIARNTTATAVGAVEVLEASTDELMKLFHSDTALGFAFYRGLLDVVSDKVKRDRRRLSDMRGNLIRTQKAMKAARDIVLSNEETVISKPVCDTLDELIDNNRRANYRVSPVAGHDASLRLTDGRHAPVIELSEGHIKLDKTAAMPEGTELSAVLRLPQREMPVSGRVVRVGPDGILVRLDLLIEDYQAAFQGYLTQLQLLDFVV